MSNLVWIENWLFVSDRSERQNATKLINCFHMSYRNHQQNKQAQSLTVVTGAITYLEQSSFG